MSGVTQTLTTSFKVELLEGVHNFTVGTGDTFKIALIGPTTSITGTYGAATVNYSDLGADEASGTGYVAGGATLTSVTPISGGTTAYTDFLDVSWATSPNSFTASGALIYNSSKGNKSVAVLNFGTDKTSTSVDFSIQFPVADSTTAIVRIA